MSNDAIHKRYRKEGERFCIDLRIDKVAELFDWRDPAPFGDRDLDENFVKYLLQNARELGSSEKLKIAIKIDEPFNEEISRQIKEAISKFLAFEVENQKIERRELFQLGRWSLVFAIIFLVVATALAANLGKFSSQLALQSLQQGLTIIGWVALWRPINIFLYDWWPIWQRQKLYQMLGESPIEISSERSST